MCSKHKNDEIISDPFAVGTFVFHAMFVMYTAQLIIDFFLTTFFN